jgi:hypothetical protein
MKTFTVIHVIKCVYSDKYIDDDTAGRMAQDETIQVHNILIGKPDGKRTLGRSKRRYVRY